MTDTIFNRSGFCTGAGFPLSLDRGPASGSLIAGDLSLRKAVWTVCRFTVPSGMTGQTQSPARLIVHQRRLRGNFCSAEDHSFPEARIRSTMVVVEKPGMNGLKQTSVPAFSSAARSAGSSLSSV